MDSKLNFTERDFLYFRQWLCLDMKSVTWQGKYADEFESFWNLFFSPGLTIEEMAKRFKYAIDNSHVGPLSSWFEWLRDKFICHIFLYKKLSILDLCNEFKIEPAVAGITLRNFFVEVFPQRESYLNEKLIIINKISENISLTAKKIEEDLQEEFKFAGTHDEEIMRSMEVTLYDDWARFLRKMHKDFIGKSLNLAEVKSRASFQKILQTFSNTIAILGVSIFLFWLIEFGNRKYEVYLSEKISVYEPQFRWKNQGLKFTDKVEDLKNISRFELDIKDIEQVDDTERLLGETFEDGERLGVESEVVLTSLDSLPRDINTADNEKSEYEEEARRGYRDSRYGNTKVYRVMMRSSDSRTVIAKIKELLKKYKVVQVDNVKPGLSVPGGFYYNLYVPRTYLKEFMLQVQETATAVIYESKTRTRRNPPGKNKVFIWLKSI